MDQVITDKELYEDPHIKALLATHVTITKQEYAELVLASEMLDRLFAGGVDNWDGYDAALNNLFEE